MNSPAYRVFFGDAEREFILTPPLILELERKTGVGVGGLSKRLFAGDFRYSEIMEVIRLGLIGGGEQPKRAAELVDAYAASRPLAETFPLAVSILETAFFGIAKAPVNDPEAP
jgi:hypothetical protein